MTMNRNRIVQQEFNVQNGQQIGPWTCKSLRKIFIHNHGPASARLKVIVLPGYGDTEDKVIHENFFASGQEHGWENGTGTDRSYRVELECEGETKIYVHVETN